MTPDTNNPGAGHKPPDSKSHIQPDRPIDEPISTYPLEPADLMPKMMSKLFWDLYDGVLWWFVMNILTFFVGSLWLLLWYLLFAPVWPGLERMDPASRFIAIGFITGVVWIPIQTFAMSWMMPFARGFTHYTDAHFRLPPKGLKNVRRFALHSFFQYLITFLLLFNVYFYITRDWGEGPLMWAGYALAGLFFWLVVFANALFMYMAPMIAEGGRGWKEMLWRALYIVIVHKFFTLAVMLFLATVWYLGIKLKFAGLMLFCWAVTAALSNAAYSTVVDHHRAKDALAELDSDREEKKPATWKEKKEMEATSVERLLSGKAQPTRYQRGIRDILKPWDG